MIRGTDCIKKDKKRLAAITMALFFLASLLFCGKAFAEAETGAEAGAEAGAETKTEVETEAETEAETEVSVEDDSTVDFVLVLDNSGTMARSDPDGLTVAAAQMFIDMLPQKNARVAVVEFGSNYGESAFSSEKYTNYVSVPFPLSDITSVDQKVACKDVIAGTTQDGEYTPVGYAFLAACDVLEQGGATPGDAGILLISDFRVTGQKKEDFLDGGYNYQSLVDAEAIAKKNQWPVYTLELDFDGKNENPSDYTERIAARIRSDIPEKVGYGDYVPMTDAEDAQSRFAEIFELFFDPNKEDTSQVNTQTTDENGDAAFQFSVDEMVAELNVTLTCEDSSLIRGIEIGQGNSMSSYDLTGYSEPIQKDNRTITREDRHITIKMMVPSPGDDWKVIVHGEAETEIGMYTLYVHDMNIQLTAEAGSGEMGEGSVTVRQKDTVQFKASYIYDGIPYVSEQVYSAYPAILEIKETGEKITMTPKGSEYCASVTFDDPGTYTAKATVTDSKFRTGSIETGEYTVIVEKKSQIQVREDGDTEADQTLKPEENFEVDCSQYFLNPGDEPLTYTVELEPESTELTYVQEGEKLTFTGGISASETTVKITADNGDTDPSAAPAQKEFTVTVTNEPLTTLEYSSGPYVFAWNKEYVPDFLKGMVEQSDQIDQSGNLRFNWSDFFTDPDGYPPVVSVEETNQNRAILLIEDDEGMTLRASHPGEAVYVVTARDANDPSVESRVTLNISAYDAEDYVKQKLRTPALIVVIVLAAIVVLVIALIIKRRRG